MKMIYVFNDSRPTDAHQACSSITEDGLAIVRMVFVDATLPYAKFVMGCDSQCSAEGDIKSTVTTSRNETLADFDKIIGAGQWVAQWVENPRVFGPFQDVLRKYHERIEARRRAEFERKIQMIGDLLNGVSSRDPVQPPPFH